MTLKELSQLYWLNREIELDKERLADLQRQIAEDKTQLAVMENDLISLKSPKLSKMPKSKGPNSAVIEKRVSEIMELQKLIQSNISLHDEMKLLIQAKISRSLQLRNRLEKYIDTLPDSLLRQVCCLRFINGLSWAQVAASVGGGNTADSVRMLCKRGIEKQNQKKR